MNKLTTVVERQMIWQSKMKSTASTMFLAWISELGELVDSMGFADWKKQSRDEANMLIEAVDLAIFTINLAYYNDVEIKKLDTTYGAKIYNDAGLAYVLSYYMLESDFSTVISILETRFPTLLDILITKQALNALRQDYGYKKGDYIKQWPKGEDNVYLAELVGKDYEEVYDSLEEIYTTKVAPGVLPLC